MPATFVKLRSVTDGNVYKFEDDGYQGGDEGRPCAGRNRIIRLLRKKTEAKSPGRGMPVFYCVEQPASQFAPISPVNEWGPAQDAALNGFLALRGEAREDAVSRVQSGSASATSLDAEIKKKVAADKEAEEAKAGAEKPKAKAKAKPEPKAEVAA